MKLYKTNNTRAEAIEQNNGYTEIEGDKYILSENYALGQRYISGNGILFAYEYDKNGAATGFTAKMVKDLLELTGLPNPALTPTYGGYLDLEGILTEENGFLLSLPFGTDPVGIGAIAYQLAVELRQESVLAIHGSEVTFVYQ